MTIEPNTDKPKIPPAVAGAADVQGVAGAPKPGRLRDCVGQGGRRKSKWVLCIKLVGGSFATLAVLLLAMVVGVYEWLKHGPVDLAFLAPRVVTALNQRLGPDYHVTIGKIGVANLTRGLQLRIDGLQVLDARNQVVLQNDSALMSVSPLELLAGQFVPARLDLQNLTLHLSLLPDGSVQVTSNAVESEKTPPPEPQMLTGALMQARFTNALSALMQATLDPASPLHAVNNIQVHNGTILMQDMALGRRLQFNHVQIGLGQQADGMGMQIASELPGHDWGVAISVRRHALSADRGQALQPNLHLAMTGIDLAALKNWSGQGFGGARLSAEVSGNIDASLDAQNHLSAASFDFLSQHGMFDAGNPEAEPFLYDSIVGKAHYDTQSGAIAVDSLTLETEKTRILAAGRIGPPQTDQPNWSVELHTLAGSHIGVARPGDQEIDLSAAQIDLTQDLDKGLLTIKNVSLKGPAIDVQANGWFQGGPSPRLVLTGEAGAMPARNIVRLWPGFIAPPVRAWFRQRLLKGSIDSLHMALDFDAAALALIKDQKPAPDAALHLDGKVHDIALDILPNFPPVSNIEATGHLTGHTVHIDIAEGEIAEDAKHVMTISSGTYVMPDTGLKPAPAIVNAHMSGSLATTTFLLNSDAMRPFVKLPLDPASIEGKIDGKLVLNMLVGDHVAPNQNKVAIDAKLTDFAAHNLIGKAGFDHATLAVKSDAKGITASGIGQMFATAASLNISQPPNKAGKAVIGFTLDDAARKRLNMTFAPVTGPIGVKIEAPLVGDHKPAAKATVKKPAPEVTPATVTLDMSKAHIEDPVPGFNKVAGRPAMASFNVEPGAKGTHLDNLVFDGGGVSARGTAELNSEGKIVSADLKQVQLSATDKISAKINTSGKSMQVSVTGSNFDARAMVQAILHPKPSAKQGPPASDIDITLHVAKVTGFNDEALGQVQLRMSRHGGLIHAFEIQAQGSGGALSGAMQADGQMVVHAKDAGGLLAFLDFYRHMDGGTLDLSLTQTLSTTSGHLQIHDFILQNEPMLRQIVASRRGNNPNATSVNDPQLNLSDAPFEKLQAQFTTHAGQLNLKDAVIFGSQLGISVNGRFVFPQNYMDLHGTFVPAYGLNNIFARIPVFGVLLGGEKHEGLFAVNFRVSGPISGPTLSFNPISAIAPGFLRQIFGAGGVPPNFQPPGAQ
ncbi:MAG: AsmA-like C-terminal domain-containing protein [Hyphomicrobiales bacterium]|nr:AsmA-like C-terminal domain-containing protein [Hyphomicrobiales bacterium]MDE2115084.1 AsmA-like C-terminal domain-containing protein [Hyphomicrobiales bacterium]